MVGQLDAAYSSMEKRGAAYVPSVAEYGKKRETTRNITYAAGCIFGVGLAAWMVYITLMVNKGVGMADQQSQVLGGSQAINNSGLNVNMGKELEAMKNVLEHMAQEQASSQLEANSDEMQRRTAVIEAAPSNIHSMLEDLEFKPADEPWIDQDPSGYVHYIGLFAEDGSPLIENTEETGGKNIRRAKQTSGKKLNTDRPQTQKKNKDFVFSLRYKNRNCLEITTSSGLKAVASGASSVVLEPDTTSPTTTLTSTTPDPYDVFINEPTTSLATGTLGSSCWLLSKHDEKFYRIESATHRKYWSTEGPNGALVLSEDWERFTGIHTNFILDFSLERSNNEPPAQPSTPIPELMYGDIKIRYLNRQGVEDTGYVCDNKWGYDDASSACNTLWTGTTGIPTYRGRFSLNSDIIEFAMSGASCKNQENFRDCKFKTNCPESDRDCLAQKSMKLFDGNGYACNNRDAAGVVCGTKEQILELKKKELKASCNSSEIASSKMSIGQMAGLEEQAKKVSDLMTENKHWSEFLIPLPMTVSLMSMLILISAQYEGKVELPRPASGAWEELKWDLLTPNLYQLNGIITDAFDRSTTAMKKINVNSEEMNIELVNSIKWGTSKSKLAKVRLKRSLRNIGEYAKENFDETDATINRFEHANRFILELLSAMKNTQKLQEDEKQKLAVGLEAMQNQTNRDQEKLEDEEKLYEEYKKDVKETRALLLAAAKELETSSCLMDSECTKEGTRSCEECAWRPSNTTDICISTDIKCTKYKEYCKVNTRKCVSFKDGGCETTGDRCKSHKTVENNCNIFGRNCNRQVVCEARESYCVKKAEKVCDKSEDFCVETGIQCAKHENLCTKFEVLPAGSFCKTNGFWGGCCSGCAGREDMKELLGNVLQTSMMLDIKSLEDDSNIEVIHSIVEVTRAISSKMNEKVNKMSGSRLKRQAEETGDQTPAEEADDENTTEVPVQVDGETLKSEIKSFVLTLPLQNRQLEQIAKKNPLAKEAKSLLKNFEKVISTIDVNTPASQLTTFQKASISGINEKIVSFAVTITKETEKLDIDLSQSSFKGPSGITGKAEAYMENKIKRIKSERHIDSLTKNLERALALMATQSIDMNDMKKTINYLISCAEYLSQLKKAWGSIKDFFSKLAGLLQQVKKNTRDMDEKFGDVLLYVSESISDTIEKDLEKTTVKATAFNIFTKKVSGFYVRIMETGLLEKIRGLNSDRLSPDVLQNTKNYILNEARAMQRSIKVAVSAEQADLNDELNQKMWSIQNRMSCSLQNVQNQGQLKLLEILKDKEKEVGRIEEVVGGKDGLGLDDEDLEESGLLEDDDTLAAEEGGTYDVWAD